MKFRLGPRWSDLIITIYIVVSLFFRIRLEKHYQVSPLTSLFIGFSLIGILLIFLKFKILNPRWFGMYKSIKK